MTLGDKNDPVVVIKKQKGKVQRKAWIKDDEVVAYENCGHILGDLASTQV